MGGHACIRRMRIPVSVIVEQNVNISCPSYRWCDLSACEEELMVRILRIFCAAKTAFFTLRRGHAFTRPFRRPFEDLVAGHT
jgi:hypothetical protein